MTTPLDLVKLGVSKIVGTTADDTRMRHYKGKANSVFAPQGVNQEYTALQSMAAQPLIRLAIHAPIQRLELGAIRTGDESTDRLIAKALRASKITSRQNVVHTHGLVLGAGIVSVWPGAIPGALPVVRIENPQHIHIEWAADDPWRIEWAVKAIEVPASADGTTPKKALAWLYTDAYVRRFEGDGMGSLVEVEQIENGFGRVPFEVFAPDRDADGSFNSMVDALIPQQAAIDTMRFNLLLAAQFAAWRQRVVTGFDPVRRDANGDPLPVLDKDGQPVLDEHGQPQWIVDSPGRPGVDRLLVFPGEETKITDLAESNLSNYTTALDMLVRGFAATAQVPAAYLAGDFENVSADLMISTESTMRSHIRDMQTTYGEAWVGVADLIVTAADLPPLTLDARAVWRDVSPRDVTQIASAASQMVPNGAPIRMFLEMLPDATPEAVDEWMKWSTESLSRSLALDAAALEFGPKPDVESEAEDT